jgi:hypothetical protein
MLLDARTRLFLILAGIFSTCLVVGDIIGGKLIQSTLLGLPVTFTVGMIPFPVTFLLTDLLNEFYGKRAARFVTLVGFAMAVIAYLVIYIAASVPIAPMTHAPGWQGVTEQSFNNVFVGSMRMIIASLTAYLVAQFADIAIFHALKRATKQRFLWLRATGSTAASQLIDTITISFVAWWGLMDTGAILNIMASSYALKFAIAVGLTPCIYAIHAAVHRFLNLAPIVIGSEGEIMPTPSPATD